MTDGAPAPLTLENEMTEELRIEARNQCWEAIIEAQSDGRDHCNIEYRLMTADWQGE